MALLVLLKFVGWTDCLLLFDNPKGDLSCAGNQLTSRDCLPVNDSNKFQLLDITSHYNIHAHCCFHLTILRQHACSMERRALSSARFNPSSEPELSFLAGDRSRGTLCLGGEMRKAMLRFRVAA